MPDDVDVEIEPEVEPEAEVEEPVIADAEEPEVEEVEDLEEEEEEVEEEKVEEEEPKEKLRTKYDRPIFSEIKKDFPEFFKKYPEMREIYFREGQFSKIFPTAEDAEEALSKASNFDVLAEDLAKGSTKTLFEALKNGGDKLVSSVAQDFLPQLYNTNKDLWFETVSPVVESFIQNLWNEGDRIGGDQGENLKLAAQWAAKFGYNTDDVSKLGGRSRRTDPAIEAEKKRLAEESNRQVEGAYKAAFTQVAERTQKLLLTEIAKGISITDPYKRDKAIQDVFDQVNDVLTQDERHIKLMQSLWNRARKSSFSTESKRALVSTLLARAKQVMPAINREIMTQINPKKMVDAKKKQIAGGKVQKEASSSSVNGSMGKVDWAKYGNDRTKYIDHFREVGEKGVHRIK